MRRFVLAALVGLLVMAGQASANGYYGIAPGRFDVNVKFDVQWVNNQRSGVLGPWYLYWPYEAHFTTPAHPKYPFWPTQQTMYGGAIHAVPPMHQQGAPSYWK